MIGKGGPVFRKQMLKEFRNFAMKGNVVEEELLAEIRDLLKKA
jgi:large-conductance mechanosensitive channel